MNVEEPLRQLYQTSIDEILGSSREDIERFSEALSHPFAFTHFEQHQYESITEIVQEALDAFKQLQG